MMKVAILLYSTALTCAASAAMAQSAPTLATVPAASAASDPAPANEPQEETNGSDQQNAPAQPASAGSDIVVTGSRIATNGNSAPTPVTLVRTEQLLTSTPSSIPDALNKLPQFSLSTGPGRVSPGIISLTNVGNYLNLRGIGINRSLVLFDGRRVPATTDSGFIDTNMLPQLIVQRVEVVTAGASAAYGSDAVSGVVNFVVDRNFNGIKGVAQAGVTDRGDGGNSRVGLAAGTSFAGNRGHILVSAEHSEADAIRRSSRPLENRYFARGGAGSAASPYFTAEGARFTGYTAGSVVTGGGPLAGYEFVPGSIQRFVPGTSIGGGLCLDCSGGRFDTNTDLTPNVATTQLYGRASFEVAPAFRPYVDVTYARSHYGSNNLNTYTTSQTIYSDNAFLPAQATALLAAGGAPSFRIGRLNLEFPFYQGDLVSKGLNITAGVDGDIGGSWMYNGYYTHGEGRLDVDARNVLNNVNYFAASDAVRDATGNIVCRVSITNPGLYPGCVPINIFGSGSPSATATAYVLGTSRFSTRNDLDVGAINVTGNLFNLPAGPVAIAVGGEYRKQSLLQNTNSNPATPPSFTGIRGVAAGSLLYSNTNAGTADGSYNVKEGYAEVEAPILKDSVVGRSLALNGAVRVTDYSTSGTVTTWKAGFSYEPIEGVRFRGTRSRDIRAPSLTDLFASLRQAQNTFNDVHTGASGSIFIQQSGNSTLKPEKADTYTVGVTLQPRVLRGFSASVDFYSLKIKGAISTLTTTQINQQCEASNGTSPLCVYIVRPGGFSDRSSTNYPISILQVPFNASSLETKGIDFDVSQRVAIGETGLNLRVIANYLDKYMTQISNSANVVDETGILGRPRWSVTGFVDAKRGPFSLNYQGRFYSGVVQDRLFTYRAGNLKLPSYFISDLTLSTDVATGEHSLSLFFTINNLFDKQPPIIPQDQLPGYNYPTFQQAYDVIGRSFTSGVRLRF